MYADLWLVFTELEMERFLKGAGFKNAETAVVYQGSGSAVLRDVIGNGREVVC